MGPLCESARIDVTRVRLFFSKRDLEQLRSHKAAPRAHAQTESFTSVFCSTCKQFKLSVLSLVPALRRSRQQFLAGEAATRLLASARGAAAPGPPQCARGALASHAQRCVSRRELCLFLPRAYLGCLCQKGRSPTTHSAAAPGDRCIRGTWFGAEATRRRGPAAARGWTERRLLVAKVLDTWGVWELAQRN